MKKIILFFGVGLSLAVFAVACSHSSSASVYSYKEGFYLGQECSSQTLESTEIGITSDKITILVMADVGSILAPGLFQGSIDGMKAWTRYINANGGIACREVELLEADSQINPNETTNAYLEACDDALATVGSTALFVINVEPLNTCEDKAGNPTGIPDFAERAVEAGHACSPNLFTTAGIVTSCPPTPGEPQLFRANIGLSRWLVDEFAAEKGGLHGVFAIPSDIPSAINSATPSIRIINRQVGIKNDGEFGVSGRAEQASYGELLAQMREQNSNYARNGSNDDSLLKWRREAVAQGGFDDIIWVCSLACYTSNIAEDSEADGTYFWMSFLPFEERAYNDELDTFLTSLGNDNPPAWAAGAWASARLFEQVIADVVTDYGLNGITRARILEKARLVESFSANDFFGEIDFTSKANPSKCLVILQVLDGEFVRQFPAKKGTLHCDDDNVAEITVDPSAEYNDGPSAQDKP